MKMNKIFPLILLLFACLSCEITDRFGGEDISCRFSQESDRLVQDHISAPVRILSELLLIDRYLSDPEQQGDTTGFAQVRRKLMKGEANAYLYQTLGNIATDGQSLRSSGSSWSLLMNAEWNADYPFLAGRERKRKVTLSCQRDSLWTLVEGEVEVRTVMAAQPDSAYVVSVLGTGKTADGYDCDMKTIGEFWLKSDPNGNDRKNGRFYHTISRSGKILDSCEAIWVDGKATYKTSR